MTFYAVKPENGEILIQKLTCIDEIVLNPYSQKKKYNNKTNITNQSNSTIR